MNILAKRLERIARMLVADEQGVEYFVEGADWLAKEYVDKVSNPRIEGAIDHASSFDVTGKYSNVEECLKAACKAVNFKWDDNGWICAYNGDYSEFSKDFIVNLNYKEANNSEIAEWKAGKKRLLVFTISLNIAKHVGQESKEFDESDIPSFVKIVS